MASVAKTIVATGGSSGLGFETVKQLLQRTQPYKFIIGARDTKTTTAAFEKVEYDTKTHSISVLPLDLADLKTVKSFAQSTLEKLNKDKLDILFLNAGINKPSRGPGLHGSQWCESYVVNHLSQHYLMHLLREKLVASKSRVVVVSSGAIRGVKEDELDTLSERVKADPNNEIVTGDMMKDAMPVYSATKFMQLLGAHWWRRNLGSSVTLVAVSPGFVPRTGIARDFDPAKLPDFSKMPDVISVEQGGSNLVRAIDIEDFPEDKEQIFLTSWGEWWPKDVYALTLDKKLQDHWCPSQEEIEKEAGLA